MLVKVAVASEVVGTILAHFGITAERLMREFGLSAGRIQDYAKQGLAWGLAKRAARLAADLVFGSSIPPTRPK